MWYECKTIKSLVSESGFSKSVSKGDLPHWQMEVDKWGVKVDDHLSASLKFYITLWRWCKIIMQPIYIKYDKND